MMRNTIAIAGKEIRVYLTTWTSYIIFGAFVLLTAFFFQRLVIEFQLSAIEFTQYKYAHLLDKMNLTDWVIAPMLSNMVIFFLFMLPILTMRLLAEERRGKTLELLMTAPVRPVEIVLGKYLAGLVIMGIMLGLTLAFPLLLHLFGEAGGAGASPVDWISILVAYLGLFLMGAACVAIGLFSSSLTESQIVAVIIGFAVLLMFYIIGMAARGQQGTWQQLLYYLSITSHMDSFVRGIIRSTDVIYYLSLSFVALFLTYRVVEAERWR